MKKKNYFSSEPPVNILNYLNNDDIRKQNWDEVLSENEKEIFTSYIPRNQENISLPKSLHEHVIIEYTAMFANWEGDIVEFYLKLNNDILIEFPFLHVDHPLHAYYQLVKENTRNRITDKYENLIPAPLRGLFEYVRQMENAKVTNNEIKAKLLREKQQISMKDANEKKIKQLEMEKQKKKQTEDQSYSTLFMQYMESDEDVKENPADVEEKPAEVKENPADEMKNLICKILNSKKEFPIYLAKCFLHCIEKLKYLQYGSKEYSYFYEQIMLGSSFPYGHPTNVTSADFLNLIFLLDEKKSVNSNAPTGRTNEDHAAEKKDNVKMIQDCRRERAKMILHGFKKK
ncbi:hypothetical protein, conserved [Plasmodium gonderi]|uniref:SURP motif domain-containing protein n=1 Tax=Plasmodium gonderi TaxID=77519 RepID=A0A1Y1JJG9_PLAGO|nr:hypothetical protein, conserved [Plasmodium gonderi]GAW81788.1 hypothetical protein, conserved [Plasmodium gonderi]